MTKVYKVYCEYDICQDNKVFGSKESAAKWMNEAWEELRATDPETCEPSDEAEELGLIGITEYEFVP